LYFYKKNIMKRSTFILLFVFLVSLSFSQIISQGSTWKYLDDGSDQGTAWQQPGFDDSGWAQGPAQLGYGDGDEATVLSYGSDPNHKYITYYFRQSFQVTDPDEKPILKVGIVRDDGAVVYINGTEVFRSNMPSGEINYQTNASHTVSGDDEDTFFTYKFLSDVLQSGDNTIAVEIHQRSATSSDISFDLEMEFADYSLFRKAPYLLSTGNNDEMLIVWQLDSTKTCLVEWGTDTTYADGSETTEEYGSDHQHQIALTGLTSHTKYFYRVSCGNTYEKTGNFITGAEDDAQEISFYAYGDTRTNGGMHNQVAERILDDISQHPDAQTFIISSGDLVANGNSEDDWQNQFFSSDYEYIQEMLASLPYVAAIGNHEGQGALFHKYFPYPMFVSSRYYYSFDYGLAHFTVIDQFTSYSVGSTQYEWMVNDLASTNKNWKIMIFHEPGWSAGGGHANNSQVQNVIQPLCLQYGVDLVINGHNHYYSRAVVYGIDHITTGGGGAPLYTPNPNADSIVKISKSYHYCRVHIDGDTLTFTAIDKDGNVIETFNRHVNYQSVYENPEKDHFKVYSTGQTIRIINNENLKGLVTLYDDYGRTIQQQQLRSTENAIRINVSGIYFVRIDYQGKRVVKKVFVR